MSARGRQLELAIKHAAIQYRREGRALLIQQYPRVSTVKGNQVVYTSKAPLDFLGCIGDAPGGVEAKEHGGKSLPLAVFDACPLDPKGQHAHLTALTEFGFDIRLVVHFTDVKECYVVGWEHVALFIGTPRRKSLSLNFFRAHGQLVPITDEHCQFLDGAAHPESERCLLDEWEERERPVVSLDAPDLESDEPRPSKYAGLSPDEVRARLMESVNVGTERQLKTMGRRRTWKRRAV